MPTAASFEDSRHEGSLDRLYRLRKPEIQAALLFEALELLNEQDRRILAQCRPGGSYEAMAVELGIRSEDAASRYAVAVHRLRDRLEWIVAGERRGMSPVERRALGHVLFFQKCAQEVAVRLSLPVEAVERWIRRAESPSPSHPGPGS